ncbi:Replication factor A protein 1, partial [Irineochytrium annulatum]
MSNAFSVQSLSNGFVSSVMASPDTTVKPMENPVLQVISMKKLASDSSSSAPDRYRIMVSDGINYMQSMLSSSMNRMVEDETIARYGIIMLKHYICNEVSGKRILILLIIECLTPHNKDIPRLGNPTDVASGAHDEGGGNPTAVGAVANVGGGRFMNNNMNGNNNNRPPNHMQNNGY